MAKYCNLIKMYKARFCSFIITLLAIYLIAGVGCAYAEDGLYYPRMPGAKITHAKGCKLSLVPSTLPACVMSTGDSGVECDPATDAACTDNVVPLGNCDPEAKVENDNDARPLYQKSCAGQGITQSNFLINVTFDPKQPSPYAGTGAMVQVDGAPTLPLCTVKNSMVCNTPNSFSQTALGANPTCYASAAACTSAGKTCAYPAVQNENTCNNNVCPWSEVLYSCNSATGQSASTCGLSSCPAGTGCVAATNPVFINTRGCYALQQVEYGATPSVKTISQYGTDGTQTVSYNNNITDSHLGDYISGAGFTAPAVVGGQIIYGGSPITFLSTVNTVPVSGNVKAILKDASGNNVYTRCKAPAEGSVIPYNGVTYTFAAGSPTPTDANPPTGTCSSGTVQITYSSGQLINPSPETPTTNGMPVLVDVVYKSPIASPIIADPDGTTPACTTGTIQQYASGKYVRDEHCNRIVDINRPTSSGSYYYLQGGGVVYNSGGTQQKIAGRVIAAVSGIFTNVTIANSLFNTVFYRNSATLQKSIEKLQSQNADFGVNTSRNIIPGTTITRISFDVTAESNKACVYAYASDVYNPGTWRAEYAYPKTLDEVYGATGISPDNQPLLSGLRSSAGIADHCVKMPPPTLTASSGVLSWGTSSISPICTDYNTSSSRFYGKDIDGKIVKKSFTGVAVECIRDSMLSLFFPSGDGVVSFFIQVQNNLYDLIMLVLVLYIIFFGYKLLMNSKHPKKEDWMWLVLKFALIAFFALGTGMTQLLPVVLSVQDRLSIIFMEAGLGRLPLTLQSNDVAVKLRNYNDAKDALSSAPLAGSAVAQTYLTDANQKRNNLQTEINGFTDLAYEQTNANQLGEQYNKDNSDCIANGGTNDAGLRCLKRKYNEYIAQKEAEYIVNYRYESTQDRAGNYHSSGNYTVPSFCTALNITLQGGGAAGTFKPFDNSANTAAEDTYKSFAGDWVTYTGSGSYTTPSFCKQVEVQAWGGGAAGRYSASGTGGDYDVTGASGAYVDQTGTSTAGSVYGVTIGSGGTSMGGNGGDTSFGGYVVAGGGKGGAAAHASNTTALGGYASGSWVGSSTKTGIDGTSCSNASVAGVAAPSSLDSPSAQSASACPYNGASVSGVAAVGFGSGGCCSDDVVSHPSYTDADKTAKKTAYKNSHQATTYSSSGTYTVPSFCKKITAQVWGGGGAGHWTRGGSCGGTRDNSGGAGGYASGTGASNAGTSFSVTVGSGGASNGLNGGPSSFGGMVIGNEGAGSGAGGNGSVNASWTTNRIANGENGSSVCSKGTQGTAAYGSSAQSVSGCSNSEQGTYTAPMGGGGCAHDDSPEAYGKGGSGQVIVSCDTWDFTDFTSSNVNASDSAAKGLSDDLQAMSSPIDGSWGKGGGGELRAKCSSFDFADLNNVITNPSTAGYTGQAITLRNALYGNSPSGGSGAKASANYTLPANNAGASYTVNIGNGGSGSGSPGSPSYFGTATLMYANGGSGIDGGTAGGTITGLSPTTGTAGTIGVGAVSGAGSPSGGIGQPAAACVSGGTGSATNGGGGCASYQNQMAGAGAKGSAGVYCSSFTFSSSTANINDSNADQTDAHIIANLLSATPNDIQVQSTIVDADQQDFDIAASRYCTDITAYCTDIAAIRNYEYSINQLNNNNDLAITAIPVICNTTYSYTDSAGNSHNCNAIIPASQTCQYPSCRVLESTEQSLNDAVKTAKDAYDESLRKLSQDQAAAATDNLGYEYCDFSGAIYPSEKGYMQLWDTIDCKISRYLGIGDDTSSSANPNDAQMLRVTILAPVSAAYGFPIFVLGMIVIVISIMIIVRVVHMYILAMIALVLLFYITPLVLPSFLFKFTTESTFNGWVGQILLYWLQPVFLFVYLSFMLICIDTVMFAGNHKFDQDNLLTDAGGKTISSTNTDCQDKNAVGCILQQISMGHTNYPSDTLKIITIYHMNFPDEGKQLCIGLLKLMIIIYIAYAAMEQLERVSTQLLAPFAIDARGVGGLSSAPVAAPSAVVNKIRQGANQLKGVGEKALGGMAYAVKNPDKVARSVSQAAKSVYNMPTNLKNSAKDAYNSTKDAVQGKKFMNELGAARALGQADKKQAAEAKNPPPKTAPANSDPAMNSARPGDTKDNKR